MKFVVLCETSVWNVEAAADVALVLWVNCTSCVSSVNCCQPDDSIRIGSDSCKKPPLRGRRSTVVCGDGSGRTLVIVA